MKPYTQPIADALSLKLSDVQALAIELLIDTCEAEKVTVREQVAYILATVYHECRFKSIPEIRAKPGTVVWKMQERYWHTGYYGRGFSQLTWKANYLKFSKIVGQDLVKNPDLCLNPDIGAKIIVIGMRDGLFSGVSLSKYLPNKDGNYDWMGARRIVNGTFQAEKVATAAIKVLHVLNDLQLFA